MLGRRFWLFCAAFSLAACSSDGDSPASGGNAGSGAGASGGSAGTAGSGGGAGAHSDASAGMGGDVDAGTDAAIDVASDAPAYVAPAHLSQAGLYSDIATLALAPGVEPYHPQFALWSDGASKARWVYLPPGTQIDTSDMDFWSYPVGTKFFKEFTRDGVRVETRMLHKHGPKRDDWEMIAYQWRLDLSDADPADPNGVQNANGTGHDIPSKADCKFCHGNLPDIGLSFTAVQLSHAESGVNLTQMIADGRLTQPPSGPFAVPGDATAQAALGYLHANCGLCHNSYSFVGATLTLRMWLTTSKLDAVTSTPTYVTSINVVPTSDNGAPASHRITPNDPSQSAVYVRLISRGTLYQMPPIATELVPTADAQNIADWINAL